jgi:hypothetical protein
MERVVEAVQALDMSNSPQHNNKKGEAHAA